jgi:NitT/TauT family transport system ATP-binding protein
MPANVRAGQVIGLVEVTGGLDSAIDVPRLADEFGSDIATFLPILDAAEMLGLVKNENGDISLTEFGRRFQKTAKHKVMLLKQTLAKIEPFKTSLELASARRSFSVHDVAEALREKGIIWHHNHEVNETLVQSILLHWVIYGGLLMYSGKTGKYQKC